MFNKIKSRSTINNKFVGDKKKISKNTKESIFFLQLITFLEYFDIMIYMHIFVFLNEIFLSSVESNKSSILAVCFFCATYFLRLLGSVFFGYIGDKYGRRIIIFINIFLIVCCSMISCNLPLYLDSGILSVVFLLFLRIICGVSVISLSMGSRIYITEMTTPPYQYQAVISITIAGIAGSATALVFAALMTNGVSILRFSFCFNFLVALIFFLKRKRFKETLGFIYQKNNISNNRLNQKKITYKSYFALLSIFCGWPLCFYIGYIYFVPVLKFSFDYSSKDIIIHNFLLSIIQVLYFLINYFLSKKIHPINISKINGFIFMLNLIICPIILEIYFHALSIFFIQAIFICGLSDCILMPILIKHFPILNRFKVITFIHLVSRTIMYIIISFSFIYFNNFFGQYVLWVIGIPIVFCWLKSVFYYEYLENVMFDSYQYK